MDDSAPGYHHQEMRKMSNEYSKDRKGRGEYYTRQRDRLNLWLGFLTGVMVITAGYLLFGHP